MAIYTRFGEEVQFQSARIAPVWVERTNSAIKHFYKPKSPTRLTKSIDETPYWFVTATGEKGRNICDGKWMNVWAGFVADGGFREIDEELRRINPDDAARYEEWNKAGGPKARELFPLIDEKQIR